MKIAKRLGLGFGLTLALLASMGYFTLSTVNYLSELNRKLYEHPFAVRSAVLEVEREVIAIHRTMKDVVLARNRAELKASEAIVAALERGVYKKFIIIKNRFLGDKESYEKVEALFRDWKPIRHEVITLALNGDSLKAAAITKGKGNEHVMKIIAALTELDVFANNKARSFLTASQQSSEKAFTLMLVCFALALLLMSVLTVAITRSIAKPAKEIAQSSEALASGDLTRRITYKGKDEIGQMAESLRRLLAGVIGEGQSIKNGITGPLWTSDNNLVLTYMNNAAAIIAKGVTGLNPEEIIGKLTVGEAFGDPQSNMSKIAALCAGDGKQHQAEVFFRIDGQDVCILESTSRLLDMNGEPMGVMGVGTDITIRKKAENALSESESRFREFFESESSYCYMVSGDGLIIDANRAAVEAMHYQSKDDLIGKPILTTVYPPESKEQAGRLFEKWKKNGFLDNEEIVICTRDGQRKTVLLSASAVRDNNGNILHSLSIQRDISEIKQAFKDLRESRSLLNNIIEQSPFCMMITDRQGTMLRMNKSCKDKLKVTDEEMIGRYNIFDDPLISEQGKTGLVESVIKNGDTANFILEYKSDRLNDSAMGNNSQLIVDVTMFPVKDQNGAITNVVVEYTDVSQQMRAQKEQRILEGKLRQAQKMEAVGTLAGGIAHDFNNILAAITGYAELALEENLSGNTSPRDIDQILQAAMKAKELVKGILTFSRKTETEFKPLDFNREIRQSISMLKRTIPRMVSITESLSDGLPMVRGDSAQLQQLVLNLGSNANLAMPDGGSLIFETKMVNADDKLCLLHEGLEPGAYVEMTVTDTGMGMDEQTLEHLYEPFYTTREVGSGTGLGLAMAYGIVKRHHGTISCQSRPGQGAAFKVMLPALVNEAVAYEPPEEKDKAAQFGRGETILVVDDELDLRVIAGKALTRTGYQALFAKNGEEALAVYRQNMGLIDLVLLDINMPGMGGARCLEQLKKIDSKLKVLIASGYSPNVTVTSLMEGGAIGYVAKPFVKKELLAAVRKALDSA